MSTRTHDDGSSSATTSPRSVAREIEIDATPEVVWAALTDADELTRWFPLEARVTPGLGGSVWMRWDAEEHDAGRITVWEPGRHLRIEDTGGTWTGVATDYHLRPSASGAGTILRVVSSGFGKGETWDETVDAFGRGWDFELRGLRHYLARHFGAPRVALWARAKYATSHEDAWQRVIGPGGWLGIANARALAPGGTFEARTARGDTLSGIVELAQAPRQFAAAIEQWNGGFLRVQLYGGSVGVWVSTYGVAEAEIRRVESAWQMSLESVFRTSV